MSGTQLTPLYFLRRHKVVLVLLVLAIAAYAQQVSEKSLVSISTVSKLDQSQPGELERLLARHFERSPIDASINAFLIKYENRFLLVDAGAYELVGPTGGKLPQSLRTAGVQPEDITDVFVTHIHPDHSGGLMAGKTKVFPNATIHINRKEVDYWFDKSISAAARRATLLRPTTYHFQGLGVSGRTGIPIPGCPSTMSTMQ